MGSRPCTYVFIPVNGGGNFGIRTCSMNIPKVASKLSYMYLLSVINESFTQSNYKSCGIRLNNYHRDKKEWR